MALNDVRNKIQHIHPPGRIMQFSTNVKFLKFPQGGFSTGVYPMRALQNYIIFSLLPILSRFSMEQNFQQPDYIFIKK